MPRAGLGGASDRQSEWSPGNQIHNRPKGMLLGQRGVLDVTSPARSQAERAERTPDLIAGLVQHVRLQPGLPVPTPLATLALQVYGSDFAIGKQVDPGSLLRPVV